MRYFKSITGLTLLLLWLVGISHADRPRIEIEGANFVPLPLAVPYLKNLNPKDKKHRGLGQVLTNIITNDLKFSSVFNLLNRKSFLADLAKEGLTAKSINFQNWLNVGAQALIKGGYSVHKNGIKIELKLFDVAQEKEIFRSNLEGKVKEHRKLIHCFCNQIIKFYTHVPGVFTTKITYIKKLGGFQNLWMMDYDGHHQTRLTNNRAINLLPAWNPIGADIIFTSFIRHKPELFNINLLSNKMKMLSGWPGLNIGAAYSPDGKKIALTLSKDGNSEIYVMDSSGKNLKRLTKNWGIDSSATWSPDGKKISFVSSRSGNPHIYMMDANGKNPKRLTFKGKYNQTPDWSPRGDRIVLTARDERNVFDIFSINLTTMEIRRLTQDQGNNEEPSWSPDGLHIAFTSTRDGESKIYLMDYNGDNQRRITHQRGEYLTPDWSNWWEKK